MSNAASVGQFGFQAAKAYQAVNAHQKLSQTVQYTLDIQAKGASHDLFKYAATFAQNPNAFTATEIQAASGLPLNQLDKPNTILKLWDTNGDQKVDLKEAFVGLAHLDASDGKLDGKITQEGREAVSNQFFNQGVAKQVLPIEVQLQQIDGQTEQVFKQLNLDNLDAKAIGEIVDDLNGAGEQTKKQAIASFDGHVNQRIDQAQDIYTQLLRQTGQSLDITERFHGYQCACCP